MARSNQYIASVVASNLRMFMSERGMNAKELAEATGINYVQLRRYINEKEPTHPSDEALEKLAKALKVEVADLYAITEGRVLDELGEIAALIGSSPLEVAESVGISKDALLEIANERRPFLKAESKAISKLWRKYFPKGLDDMIRLVGPKAPVIRPQHIEQAFTPPASDDQTDMPELDRIDLLVTEFKAWARRTAIREPSALDVIEDGVRQLINDVEEKCLPRAAPKDAKRA